MTPLDRILDRFPAAREILLRLDEYLPLIVGGAIVLLIALVFSWAAFGAPRRAARLFRRLEAQGYGPARPDDLQLKQALDRLTPIMFHTYALSTVTETSPWGVKLACARYEGWTSRYVAMINRSVSRTTPQSTTLEHQFTIAVLEMRALSFNHDVHVAGDRYTLDPQYGLRAVDEGSLGSLSSCYVVHTPDGTLAPLPTDLQKVLLDRAPFLSIRAATGSRADPFLFHARIKFTPEGWGLISSEFVYHQKKMNALMEAVDRISRSLG